MAAIDEALAEVYVCRAGRINFKGAQCAPDHALADEANPLRSLLPIATRGAAKDAHITRPFLQRRELHERAR